MVRGFRWWLIAVVCGLAPALSPLSVATAQAGVPAFDHVFVILMENRAYSDIIGNTSQAPYINQLADRYGVATNFHAIGHPSLPNYLALVGGSTFGIRSDCTTCFVNAPNLVADRVAPSGRTWRAYMESMSSTCKLGTSGRYVQKHNPFVYFDNIRTTSRCDNVVPYTHLAADLHAAGSTPDFAWISPNMCNDMHDCSIKTGDTWLKDNLPAILNAPAFTSQNSLVVITWDEDDGGQGNHIPLLMISKQVRQGFRSAHAYNHYSLLKTIEAGWGLAPLGANDRNAAAMSDFFSAAATAGNPQATGSGSGTAPGGGASRVVHETNASAGATNAATVHIPATTGGSALVVLAALRTGVSKSVGSVTDSSGASWAATNKVASAASGANGRIEIWWRMGVPAGITSVMLKQPSGQADVAAWAIKVLEVRGLAPPDTEAHVGNTQITTLQTGRTAAVEQAGAFVIGAVASAETGLSSAVQASGWTALRDFDATGVVGRAAIVPSTTAHQAYEASWAASKPSSGGGAVVVFGSSP